MLVSKSFSLSELLSSLMEYMTGRKIVHKKMNRLKETDWKNRMNTAIQHAGCWVSVKTKKRNRLITPQVLVEFFNFDYRGCNFQRFTAKIDDALKKIGSFYK